MFVRVCVCLELFQSPINRGTIMYLRLEHKVDATYCEQLIKCKMSIVFRSVH